MHETKSERLVVLVTPQEMRMLEDYAHNLNISKGQAVRQMMLMIPIFMRMINPVQELCACVDDYYAHDGIYKPTDYAHDALTQADVYAHVDKHMVSE